MHSTMSARMRARSAAAAAVAVAAATLLAGCAGTSSTPIATPTSQTSPPADLARFYGQSVQWRNCGDADCARVLVPVDYAKPDGSTLELSVTRVPASGDRIGSLLVNPGGPGGSAFDYAKAASTVLGADVRASYDVIGVDPRGVGGSTPVECLTDAQRDALVALDGTPTSPDDVRAIEEASAIARQGCEARAADRVSAVSTATAARDLDIVRAVLGDPVLNYLGKSYGTYLGAVYAERFPDRVGRMVLDGVLAPELDLVARTQAQAAGFEDQVADFARDCASQDDCPFAGDEAQVLSGLRDWLRSLDAAPLRADGRTLGEGEATYAVLSYLYFPSKDYPELRSALRAAVLEKDAAPMLDLLDVRIGRGPDGRFTDNGTDAFYAVTCTDTPFRGGVDEVRRLAADWATRYPTFGESLAWGLLSCADWPAAQEPAITDITAAGSAPILVVGTAHDPATPGPWAISLAESLDNGRLLQWNGRNHTAYREGSSCIDAAIDDYLVRGTLPSTDATCD